MCSSVQRVTSDRFHLEKKEFSALEDLDLGPVSGMVVVCMPSDDWLLSCNFQTECCSDATCMFNYYTVFRKQLCFCYSK